MSFSFDAGFPTTRLRRLRLHPVVRGLARTVALSPEKWILPLFVKDREETAPIPSMPGHSQLTLSDFRAEIRDIQKAGIGGVMIFGIPKKKDAVGSDAMSDEGNAPKTRWGTVCWSSPTSASVNTPITGIAA